MLVMTTTSSNGPAVSRRAVLAGAAAVGAVGALAACGTSPGGNSANTGGGGNTGAAGPLTVKAADVPVGGGQILKDARVVVTQPTAGTYKAFNAICTHQGCLVGAVDKSVITCICHGSQFSAVDGSVKRGPAIMPLGAKTVTASGTDLTIS